MKWIMFVISIIQLKLMNSSTEPFLIENGIYLYELNLSSLNTQFKFAIDINTNITSIASNYNYPNSKSFNSSLSQTFKSSLNKCENSPDSLLTNYYSVGNISKDILASSNSSKLFQANFTFCYSSFLYTDLEGLKVQGVLSIFDWKAKISKSDCSIYSSLIDIINCISHEKESTIEPNRIIAMKKLNKTNGIVIFSSANNIKNQWNFLNTSYCTMNKSLNAINCFLDSISILKEESKIIAKTPIYFSTMIDYLILPIQYQSFIEESFLKHLKQCKTVLGQKFPFQCTGNSHEIAKNFTKKLVLSIEKTEHIIQLNALINKSKYYKNNFELKISFAQANFTVIAVSLFNSTGVIIELHNNKFGVIYGKITEKYSNIIPVFVVFIVVFGVILLGSISYFVLRLVKKKRRKNDARSEKYKTSSNGSFTMVYDGTSVNGCDKEFGNQIEDIVKK